MELKKTYNDRRELVIVILGAMLLCLVFSLVAHQSPQGIDVAVFVDNFRRASSFEGAETRQIIADIDRSEVFIVYEAGSHEEAMQRLDNRNSRAVIVLFEGPAGIEEIKVTADTTDFTIQQVISKELPPILEKSNKNAAISLLTGAGLPAEEAAEYVIPLSYDIKTNEWKDLRYFDSYAAPLIILMVLGICLATAVTGVTSERSAGTIERIFASPYKGSEFILSKILAHSVLAIIVSVVIVFTLYLLFGVAIAHPFLALLIAILVAINAVITGLLISSVTYSELESVALGISCYLLFMILMGFTWPLDTMHPFYRFLSSLTPNLYGVHAIREVSLVGWGLDRVWTDLVILCGFIAAQVLLTILILRREIR
jgi:ABC-2 type transport system permease protein